MTPAETLARFASGLRYSNLDTSVVASAKRHLLDTLGVGLLGAQQPMPRNALAGLASIPGSAGAVPVWGTRTSLSAPFAALANGISSHVLDFDDTHTKGIVHGSAIVAPVVMSMGFELDAPAADAITAFVAGWEVAARVGLATQGTMHERGYHTTSIAGVFGAATAAAKLLGLDEQQTCHAIALAGSQASGINEYQTNGSSSKILHTGWAAHAGIAAAYLARSGMTGPPSVFEGRLGLLNAYGDIGRCDVTELTRRLGERWETTLVSIKPYACCHFGHAFIDCAIELANQGVTPDRIREVQCVVPQLEVAMVCEPQTTKKTPDSPYAAKFSLPFMVAAALIDREIGNKTFSPESIRRKDVLDLASLVNYRVVAPGETTFPEYFPGWLEVSLKTGERLEHRMDRNRGTPGNPMSDADVARKFADNVADIATQGSAGQIVDAVSGFETTGIRGICDLIRMRD